MLAHVASAAGALFGAGSASAQPASATLTIAAASDLRYALDELLQAYHGEGRNPSDPAVLKELAAAAGLDAEEAARVLASDDYATEVRAAEVEWQRAGIQSVPAVVINRRHLISGGQPPEVFEEALRRIAAEA